MATIYENISAVSQAVQSRLAQIPGLNVQVNPDCRRQNQHVGTGLMLYHVQYPEDKLAEISIGSTVAPSRSRSATPQVYYDNLLEIVTSNLCGQDYHAQWYHRGSTPTVEWRQSRPDAKIRLEKLVTTIAQWAQVAADVGAEAMEVKRARKAQAEAEQKALDEAAAKSELEENLRKAREAARDALYANTTDQLLRDYPEVLYQSGGYSYDPILQAQRQRVQAGAGFKFEVKSRGTNQKSEDYRPWISLDNAYCQPFSLGEFRAMMDALVRYRAETPREEWLPQQQSQETDTPVTTEPEDEPTVDVIDPSLQVSALLPDSFD